MTTLADAALAGDVQCIRALLDAGVGSPRSSGSCWKPANNSAAAQTKLGARPCAMATGVAQILIDYDAGHQ
jgi:hypothetical protein